MANKTLRWIGTGSCFNTGLGNTSFTISSEDSERTLLVDCGNLVFSRLMESGKVGEITDIVVTHTHSDHVGSLEDLGFFNFWALNRRGDDRPNLYVGSEGFADRLWENVLKGGMQHSSDEKGDYVERGIRDFFNVHVGKYIPIPELATVRLFDSAHIPRMENYSIRIGDEMFYSGDSGELPQTDTRLIFQDCSKFECGVHASYDYLKENLSEGVRAKTYLVHLSGGFEDTDPKNDGFAGFVMPGDEFELNI